MGTLVGLAATGVIGLFVIPPDATQGKVQRLMVVHVPVFASIIQAAVVSLAGSALGIVAVLGLVSLLWVGFAQMGMDLSGSIPMDVAMVITSLVIGTVVSIAAAVLPARHAA